MLGAVANKLAKANMLITDLIGPLGQLQHYLFLKGPIPDWNHSNQNVLKASICLPNSDKILPHILSLHAPPHSLHSVTEAEGMLVRDNGYNTYEVFIDESLKEGQASFGVFFNTDHPWNLGCSNPQHAKASFMP